MYVYTVITHKEAISDADPDPQGSAFFCVQGSGSWGLNIRKNLLKFIAFIADILLMRANL